MACMVTLQTYNNRRHICDHVEVSTIVLYSIYIIIIISFIATPL